MRTLLVVLLLCAASGCGTPGPTTLPPEGQVLLHIDTDAFVLTNAPASPGSIATVALFDRLRIDAVGTTGSCDCTRQVDATEDLFQSGQATLGIFPASGGGAVRVRLFRSSGTLSGEPDPDSTIDVTASIPAVGREGIVDRTIVLHTDDVGNPVGQTQPIDTLLGAPSGSLVGSWPGAQRVDCPTPPASGEVCVPGGAYWMGNPLSAFQSETGDNRQRLVVLPPFYMDAAEVTVTAYRSSGLVPAVAWSGEHTGAPLDYCTYTPFAGANDELPINCISWKEARAYCALQGKDLPTEAEFEYVASGLAGLPFLWGDEVPGCDDAVLARGGAGTYFLFPGDCRTTSWGGPAGGGRGALDQFGLPTGTIVDLEGNLSEATLDRWEAVSDSCWSTPGIYYDPLCGPLSSCDANDNSIVSRGGNWLLEPSGARAAERFLVDCRHQAPERGFRCVRAAGP